jgi:hypothetical protein|tara:strand:- start:569 stop:871 length:303 start_codon:yes stop_codon:yes gene_type:complete
MKITSLLLGTTASLVLAGLLLALAFGYGQNTIPQTPTAPAISTNLQLAMLDLIGSIFDQIAQLPQYCDTIADDAKSRACIPRLTAEQWGELFSRFRMEMP